MKPARAQDLRAAAELARRASTWAPSDADLVVEATGDGPVLTMRPAGDAS